MSVENNDPFTANDADRLEQQEEATGEVVDREPDQSLQTATREANEADVVEQAQTVYGDDDYPRGPVEEEPV